MPKVISFVHQKGGVGKSTLTLNLALTLAADTKVALIDFDLQGTIAQLKPLIKSLEIIPYNGNIQECTKKQDLDFILIDTPPYLFDGLPELLAHSDLAVIPTKAGYADVMAIRATIAMLNQAKINNDKLAIAVVMNMIKPNTTLTDEIKKLIKNLGVDIFHTMISDRVSFVRSLLGQGVKEGTDINAISEITELCKEIIHVLFPEKKHKEQENFIFQ